MSCNRLEPLLISRGFSVDLFTTCICVEITITLYRNYILYVEDNYIMYIYIHIIEEKEIWDKRVGRSRPLEGGSVGKIMFFRAKGSFSG